MNESLEHVLTDFEEPEYSFVGFWPRFAALIIDGILLAVTGYITSLFFGITENITSLMLTAIIPFFYCPVMEFYFGATIGKMAMGIKIVNYNLQRLTLSNVLLRNLIYFVLQCFSLSIELYGVLHPDEIRNPFVTILRAEEGSYLYMRLMISYLIFIALLYLIELLFLLKDEQYRTLHDRIGKTYVVRKTR